MLFMYAMMGVRTQDYSLEGNSKVCKCYPVAAQEG
jgi:hypothetical protein